MEANSGLGINKFKKGVFYVKILPPSISRSVDGSQSERVAIKLKLEVFRGLAMFEQAESR